MKLEIGKTVEFAPGSTPEEPQIRMTQPGSTKDVKALARAMDDAVLALEYIQHCSDLEMADGEGARACAKSVLAGIRAAGWGAAGAATIAAGTAAATPITDKAWAGMLEISDSDDELAPFLELRRVSRALELMCGRLAAALEKMGADVHRFGEEQDEYMVKHAKFGKKTYLCLWEFYTGDADAALAEYRAAKARTCAPGLHEENSHGE
jgi:hypothetical protein